MRGKKTYRQIVYAEKKKVWKKVGVTKHTRKSLNQIVEFFGWEETWIDNVSDSGNVIYFLQMEDCWGPIKIGLTGGTEESMRSRFSSIQNGNPFVLCLLGTIGGDVNEETKIHKRFKKYRMLGEWFEAKGELIGFVNRFLGKSSIADEWLTTPAYAQEIVLS